MPLGRHIFPSCKECLALPELGAAVGIAGEEGCGRHTAGVTWLSGGWFVWAAVAR